MVGLRKKLFFPLFIFLVFIQHSHAQNLRLDGTVYDYFTKKPLDAVTVQTSSGANTITDSLGKFTVNVTKKDSIFFSYLSKRTVKYPVDTITNLSNFEIALYVDAAWLPAVKVRNTNYALDSITNRQQYAKVFNFRKPGLRFTSSPSSPSTYVPGSVTAGLDLDEIINMFRFKRNRQILSMQERLIQQEQDKYINHRFTKYLVQKLTNLKGGALDSFMVATRPSYELLLSMNDIELGYYIGQCYKLYQTGGLLGYPSYLKEEQE
jgi:hypothetical protein